jgi:uncharacterized membrane protein
MKSLMVAVFVALTLSVKSQQSINSSGGNALGSNGTASFSVGQIDYTSEKSSSGSFSLGVQQTFEIEIIDGVEDVINSLINFNVFPNPTTESINLKIETKNSQIFQANLYDSNGKLLENVNVINNQSQISMQNLPPAVYFLKVSKNNEIVKSFKIIKR